MKRKQVIALLGSIALVLALVLSACTPATTTPTTPTTPAAPTTPTTPTTPSTPQVVTKEVEPVYKVLNPMGTYIAVQTQPLAPRLTTLAGKTILYYQSEASAVMMPPLLVHLKKDYPNTTFNVIEVGTFGASTPGSEITGVDAVIRGISW